MCDKCFNKEFLGFGSNKEFEIFLKDFETKIAKSVHFVKQEYYKTDNHTVYSCENCKTLWWLSDPDNHWRGYFMKADNAKKIIEKDAQRLAVFKYACILILIVATGFILFKIFI